MVNWYEQRGCNLAIRALSCFTTKPPKEIVVQDNTTEKGNKRKEKIHLTHSGEKIEKKGREDWGSEGDTDIF